jgi:hypothetical protein
MRAAFIHLFATREPIPAEGPGGRVARREGVRESKIDVVQAGIEIASFAPLAVSHVLSPRSNASIFRPNR